MSVYIKQYGFQRSGTNVLKALIEINFKKTVVLSNYLGDKHDPADWTLMQKNLENQDPRNYGLTRLDRWKVARLLKRRSIPVVINVKEPISWVNSFYKYQQKKALFKNPNANFPFDLAFAEKVLTSYEKRLLSWGNFYQENDLCLVFRHEQIVSGLSGTELAEMAHKFALTPSDNFPVGELDGYARRGIDSQRGKDLVNDRMSFDRRYHLENLWRKDVPERVIEFLEAEKRNMMSRLPRHISEMIE